MKTKDILGFVGWATALLYAAAWIPLVGPFLSLLTPLPFLYYSSKLGFQRGLKVAALATCSIILVGKVLGYPQMILFGLEFVFLGLVLAALFKRRISTDRTICIATGFMLLVGFGFLSFLALSKNIGPRGLILSYLGNHLQATIKTYRSIGITEEQALELERYGKFALEALSKIYPALMAIGTAFAVWLNVVISRPIFRLGDLQFPDPMPMDRWQAPDHLVWGVIFSGFALFLPAGGIKWAAVNALIVLMAVYLFQGLSILLFFLNKYRVPSWFRIGIYFLIIIQQLFLAILALAGLFDQWIDFRKIHRRSER